jgi:hypothetical protein
MEISRCPACGETRWHVTAIPVVPASECPACGHELEPERRLPGRRVTAPVSDERRGETSTTPLQPQ